MPLSWALSLGHSGCSHTNPDVSFREESPEGAILFNPDTDALQIINPTGVVIWRFLAHPRKKGEIVQHLIETFEDVTQEQVEKDADEFIENLYSRGFIGEVLEENVR